MLKVGFIGCGGIIERRHLPGLLEMSDVVQITAMSDISEERVALLADRAGVSAEGRYADYHELLAQEQLDLVIVATPLAHHENPVIEAAGRVPSILVEKPLAADVATAERMMEACDREDTKLNVVHNQLFRPAIQTAAELIATGDYGKPFLYRDEMLGASHRPGSGTEPNWRTQRAHGGGGCLIDNAYHSIYTAEKLLGAPVTSVQAQTGRYTHDYDVEDTALVIMQHANGTMSSVQAGWSIATGRYTAKRVYELHASAGSFLFDHEGSPLAVFRPDQENWMAPDMAPERSDDAGYYAFRDRYFAAMEAGEPLPIPATEALHVLSVVEAAYESARAGTSSDVAA
jgi:predicted dehydrogenase